MKTLRLVARRAAQKGSWQCSGRRSLHNTTGGQSTIPNLVIDKNTRVMYQGFTGRAVGAPQLRLSIANRSQATSNARDTIAYGTNVVGGVSPGKGGLVHLGLPVFNTAKEVSPP